MDTVGEGEGGMNGESNMETYTLPYVKLTASGTLLCDAGSLAWYSVMASRAGLGVEGWGRVWEGGTCVCLCG